MTVPRTKRQFAGAASDPTQRQITTFFAKTSSTSSPHTAHADAKQSAPNGPALPAQVQTDLLTVGMRVRKAVPEGYKTGSTFSAFSLWSEHGSGSNSSATQSQSHSVSTGPTRSTYSSAARELEPFCGINKVGGLAFQPAYHSASANVSDDDDDDLGAMPGLTSSQDTVSSVGSSSFTESHIFAATAPAIAAGTAGSRKRLFTSEEDEAAHEALSASLPYRGPVRFGSDSSRDDDWLLEQEISPRNLAPPAGLWENARVLAMPRGRSKPHGRNDKLAAAAARGQENIMVVLQQHHHQQQWLQQLQQQQDGNDFEEASFLDYAGLGSEASGMDVE